MRRKRLHIFENSGAARRTGQGGFEEPADEFRLTVGSGFRENVLRVGARRRLGDFESRGGGEKPVAGDDFGENAGLGGGQPEPCGEVLDLGAEAGGGIDDEDGGGRPVEIEDRRGPDRGERDDMGDKRRAIFAAAKLEGSTDIAFASFRAAPPRRASACRRAVSAGLVAASRPCSYRKPIPRRMRSSALALAKTTRQSPVKRNTAKPAAATAAPSELGCCSRPGRGGHGSPPRAANAARGFPGVAIPPVPPKSHRAISGGSKVRALWALRRRPMATISAHPCGRINSL